MKISKEQALMLLDCKTPNADFSIVKDGNWRDEGKYQHRELIFKFQDKLYSIDDSRSGSYYSDYYYSSEDWDDEVECEEVEEYTVTITKYRIKK